MIQPKANSHGIFIVKWSNESTNKKNEKHISAHYGVCDTKFCMLVCVNNKLYNNIIQNI